jgi:hypothetical protein
MHCQQHSKLLLVIILASAVIGGSVALENADGFKPLHHHYTKQ